MEIFIGTGALLGIFAYICRQRPVIDCIHWWRWRSGAPAAWHHWCGHSQNSIGINWIPIECSSESNNFWWHTWELLVKGGYLKLFPLLANSQWKFLRCLGLPAAAGGANYPLLPPTVKVKLGPSLSLYFSFSILLVFSIFLHFSEYLLVI